MKNTVGVTLQQKSTRKTLEYMSNLGKKRTTRNSSTSSNVSFWAPELLEFVSCFRYTLFTWLPCSFLFLFLPVLIYSCRHSQNPPLKWSNLFVTKIVTKRTVGILISLFLCRLHGIVSSGLIFNSLFLFVLFGLPELIYILIRSENHFSLHCFVLYYAFIIVQLFLSCFADKLSRSSITQEFKEALANVQNCYQLNCTACAFRLFT
uniref:Uncharacterized protein n=1 Tax=Romanomermis culicivorax TaxID=13658 RepID=A0A915JRE0_ROMCU